MIGGLLTPCETAVICAVPTGPGVQTCGLVKEFHVPAQEVPLLAMVNTAGFVDWKVKLAEITLPRMLRAVAVKTCVLPSSTEALRPVEQVVDGERHKMTLAGTGFVTTLVVLLLPQPARKTQPKMMVARNFTETNLPMNPSTKE